MTVHVRPTRMSPLTLGIRIATGFLLMVLIFWACAGELGFGTGEIRIHAQVTGDAPTGTWEAWIEAYTSHCSGSPRCYLSKSISANERVSFRSSDGLLSNTPYRMGVRDVGNLGPFTCTPPSDSGNTNGNYVGIGTIYEFVLQTDCVANLVADAGPDQPDVQVGTMVTIDGGQSGRPPGTTILWEITAAPVRSTSSIVDQTVVSFPFDIDEPGVYTFRLTLTYDSRTDTDEVTVTTAGPTIDPNGVSPTMGPPSTAVNIFGANFSPSADGNVVRFNGVQANHTVLNPTEIHTSVPTGATTGPVTVTVEETQQVATSSGDFTVTPPPNPWTFHRNPVTDNFRSVSFSDATTGMMVGSSRNVLRTTDGGVTWTSVTTLPMSPVTSPSGISMPSGDTAYVVGLHTGGGGVVRTSDGGTSAWAVVRDESGESYNAVHFIDHQEGWVVGANGVIIHTNDAGSSWTSQASNTSVILYSVHFVDNLNGVAVGDGGTITYTTNGGMTWSATSVGSHRLRDVTFADAMNGLIVGRETGVSPFDVIILRTTTGVAGFAAISHDLPQNNDIWAIAYPTPTLAYVYAPLTRWIYRGTNDAQNWTQEQGVGNSGDYFDILMLDATNGVAVGDVNYAYRR